MTTLYEKTDTLAPPTAAEPVLAPELLVQEPAPERDPFMAGAEAALRRAAKKARRRAIALNGYVATYRDGKIVYDTEP